MDMSRFFIALVVADLLALVYLITFLIAMHNQPPPLPPGWYLVGPAA